MRGTEGREASRSRKRRCWEIGWQGFDSGTVSIRLRSLSDGRRVAVAWHRYTGDPLGSWVFARWEFERRVIWQGEDVMAKFLKQVRAAEKRAASAEAASDKTFALAHPAIAEFLTVVQEEGKPRETATLLIFAEAGVWKCCLNDRQSGLTLWAAGETVAECLLALEAILEGPSPQWRDKGKRVPQKK